jgi:hypothetical protein
MRKWVWMERPSRESRHHRWPSVPRAEGAEPSTKGENSKGPPREQRPRHARDPVAPTPATPAIAAASHHNGQQFP